MKHCDTKSLKGDLWRRESGWGNHQHASFKRLTLEKKENEGTFRYCMDDCCKEWVDTSTRRPKDVMILEKGSVEDENIPKPTQ